MIKYDGVDLEQKKKPLTVKIVCGLPSICWNFWQRIWEINNLGYFCLSIFHLLYLCFYCPICDSCVNISGLMLPFEVSWGNLQPGLEPTSGAVAPGFLTFLKTLPFPSLDESLFSSSCIASLPCIRIWIRFPQGVTYSFSPETSF